MDLNILFQSTLILFAIVNPIGSIPLVLQLTEGMPAGIRRRTFNMAILTSAAILFIFIISGKWIIANLFRIQIPDLMAAGGLLLLIIAIDHLIFGALMKSVEPSRKPDAHHVGAVPLACPILAGPGAMITVLVICSEYGFLIAAASVAIVLAVTWAVIYFSQALYRMLGEIACTVLSKILCLFLAAIGINLLMRGLSYYFK